MTDKLDFLYNDEITVLNLRRLYENRGFKKFRMGKFESYDFYARNKDFLVGNRIITFSDLNGKLMALKPDVTLSIVKNADEGGHGRQKLYYTENVYRESKDIHEFKEIFQVGLEVLGEIDLFETVEIVTLAIKSLTQIDKDAILEISHIGYTEGLIDCITSDGAVKDKLHELISSKNSHDLKKLAESDSLPKNPVGTAVEIMLPKNTNEETLLAAEEHALNAKMLEAVTELKNIYKILKKSGLEKHIKIDFSIVGDPGYYNGILMHGYVHGIPRNVLSGGRYDMLMSKMGRGNAHAMGFAIYFDALDRGLHIKEKHTTDAYILYGDDAEIETLVSLTSSLDEKGVSYTAVTSLPEGLSGVKIYTVSGDRVKEEAL